MLFHIFQGLGIAAAVGIRPFLPALVAGGLAAGDVELSFNHTGYHFLQTLPVLLVLALLAVAFLVVERRLSTTLLERREAIAVIGLAGLVLGALLCAGAFARGHHAAWPGLIAGVICAVVGVVASRPLFARVRRRLDAATAASLPLYAEAAGLLLAVLSIVAPPLGPIGLLLLLWLALGARRRGEQKYAGLRILR